MTLVLGVNDSLNISINNNYNGGDNSMDNVSESILLSVKKLLGIHPDCNSFDADIIMHINTAFLTLSQLGVGPPKGFSITDESALWSDYLPKDNPNFEAVKTYVGSKVRLVFDPPMSSIVAEALKEVTKELEFRLNVEAETGSGVISNE